MRLRLLPLVLALPLAAQRPVRPVVAPSKPLPVDTAVHQGRLANGFRYYLRHNSYPEHRLELRLVVRAGSVLEDSAQRGLAHFIEHMGFNGTTHFEKNDLVKYLESIGVRYGADLNANTGFDETTYILPVPSDKPELVDRAFDILQDWAHGDRFDSDQVAGERGVILGEWRSGLGAGSRRINKVLPVLLQGSRYAARLPIGDTGIVSHAVAGPMQRFYRDWYRPDLMALIAVGDYPLDSLQALITAHFGALRNPASERPRTAVPIPEIPGTRVVIVTDPEETSESVELLIRRPTTHYRTDADERGTLINALFSSIASERMEELARQPDAPFVGAGFGPTGFIRDLEDFELGVTAKEGQSAAAFEAALRELRRFDEHGVLPAELERAKAGLLRGRESAAAEIGKTESASFIGPMTDAFLYGQAMVSAPQRFALAQQLLPTITVAQVDSAIRQAARGTDRYIEVDAPEKMAGKLPTKADLLAILARTDTMTVPAWTEKTVATALVPNPPKPGRVVRDTTYADLGITDWHLSNGVRVLVKPTDFKADEIQIGGESAGGISLLADDQLVNGQLATALVQQSGVGDFDAIELGKKMAGKIAIAVAQVDETSQGLVAFAAPKDLETALQLLWLKATEPRYDSSAIVAMTSQVRNALLNRGATPEAAFQDTIRATLARNSPRAKPLTADRLGEFDPHRAYDIYRGWFKDFNDFTFIIVGAVKLETLRPLVEEWLGSLPSTGGTHAWRDVEPVPPDGVITKVVHKGKEPVATQLVYFSGPVDSVVPEGELAAAAAGQILQERLQDKLREAMGATYGVDVTSSLDRVPRMRYRSEISFKSTPAQADTLWQAAQEIIAALRRDGPTADELEKFTAQARREDEVAVKTNDWWSAEISNYADPDATRAGRPLGELLTWSARIDALTPARVQAAMQRDFDPARVARFVLLPEQ